MCLEYDWWHQPCAVFHTIYMILSISFFLSFSLSFFPTFNTVCSVIISFNYNIIHFINLSVAEKHNFLEAQLNGVSFLVVLSFGENSSQWYCGVGDVADGGVREKGRDPKPSFSSLDRPEFIYFSLYHTSQWQKSAMPAVEQSGPHPYTCALCFFMQMSLIP